MSRLRPKELTRRLPKQIESAQSAGELAAMEGQGREACPYATGHGMPSQTERDLRNAWLIGFDNATARIRRVAASPAAKKEAGS